jgi:murein DD-endopeptidase MepM/ murein hydrolase activator NlpD
LRSALLEATIVTLLTVAALIVLAIAVIGPSSVSRAEVRDNTVARPAASIYRPIEIEGGQSYSIASGDLRSYVTVDTEKVLTLEWPVAGKLTDGFGGRHNPFGKRVSEFHSGQDIAAPKGTAVTACADGTITFAGWMHGYGDVVIIAHKDGVSTRYGHLSRILVSAGQTISGGEEISEVGSTGRATGPYLHFEVRLSDEPVDPLKYLPGTNS